MESGTEDLAHTRIAGVRSREAGSLPTNRENQLLRHLADLSPVGIVQADREGRLIYANARWCQMTGYRVEAVVGREWVGLAHPDDVKEVRETWGRMLGIWRAVQPRVSIFAGLGRTDLGVQPGDGTAQCAGASRRLFEHGDRDHGSASDA